MVRNSGWILPDGLVAVTIIGQDRISGAETVCGAKSAENADGVLDVYLINPANGPTVGGSSRDVDMQGHENLRTTRMPKKQVGYSAAITLSDHTTITFASLESLSDSDFIALG